MPEHLLTLPPLRGRRSLYAAVTAALLIGCGGPSSETGVGGAGTTSSTSSATSCPRGAVPGPMGACMPVGIQGCADMFWEDDNLCHPSIDKCPAGTIPKLDLGCVPVGVPGCSPEFSEDGLCAASLDRCPEGTFPVPQEGCRPIDGPDGCGDGTWGNVVEAMGDVHVDQSAPTGGDGTRAAPYQTIAEALLSVSTGGRVVIAAGTYDEPVLIQDSIEVVGRCPSMVTIAGAQDFFGLLSAVILDHADGAAVRSLSVEGHRVSSLDSKGVTIDGLVVRQSETVGIFANGGQTTVTHTWVHDSRSELVTGEFGDGVEADIEADLTIKHSAVTASRRVSLLLTGEGTAVHVEDSLFEPVLAPADDGRRMGIVATTKATLEIADSVVARARSVGVSLSDIGTASTITGCEVRDTSAMEGTESFGDGIIASGGASLSVTGSVVLRSRRVGVLALEGALATIDSTFVTKTGGDPDNADPIGSAVAAQEGATMNVLRSALSDSRGTAVNAADPGTVFQMEACAVERSSLAQTVTLAAAGALVAAGAALSASGTYFSDSGRIGLIVGNAGTTGALDHCLIERTVPDVSGRWGVALLVSQGGRAESAATAFMANSDSAVQAQEAGSTWASTGDYLVGGPESARGALFMTGSSGSLSGSVLRDLRGFGVFVHGSSATLSGCRIDSVMPLDVSFEQQTYKGVADGVLALSQSKVDASDLTVDGCERAAVLFDDSTGKLSGTRTSGGRFGLVLQGDQTPTLGGENAFRGTEKDIVTGGDLSVPDAPLPVPTQ